MKAQCAEQSADWGPRERYNVGGYGAVVDCFRAAAQQRAEAGMRLIGLDIGTTGCKAAVFEEDGALIVSARREYRVDMPHSNWAEQDAEWVWRLAQDALREVVAAVSMDWACEEEIEGIGLSVQGEAVMPVDAEGRALRAAILGMDTRTEMENAWLVERFGARYLFDRTGLPVHTVNTLPKLLWLRDHEPDLWARASQFLLYEDFFVKKMTGQAAISRCLASRTQLYDRQEDAWAEDILDALCLSPERLAEVRPSGYAVAPMKAELAASLGFVKPPLIVTGGHDQACGALGVGLTEPGLAMVSTGTAEVVEVVLGAPVITEMLYAGHISTYAHTVPKLSLAMTLNHSGGLLLRWFRDTLGQTEVARAESSGLDAYDLLLADVPDDPTSLLLLPHFAGSGTPSCDTASKGAVLGLTFNTTKPELTKAILEGVTFELRANLDVLRSAGIAIDELRAIGGGARSETWLQLKADITGIPVVVPLVTDAACWGAALLAGHAAGCFEDLATAASAAVHLEKRYEPDPARADRYRERYDLYCEVYPTLKELLHRL